MTKIKSRKKYYISAISISTSIANVGIHVLPNSTKAERSEILTEKGNNEDK